MSFAKLFQTVKNFLCSIRKCSIFIGRSPASIQVPAIIFFPFLPDRLNCGFAGLMTCHLQNKPSATDFDQTAIAIWEKIKNSGLETIIDGKNFPVHYLNGADAIQSLNMAILELKSEDAQEFLFFNVNRAENLSGIVGEMKQFLAGEEKWLEKQAAAIQSADLEVINSRILLLKDICWMLEKDILINLQKVLTLMDAKVPSAVNPNAFRKYRKLNLLLNGLDRLEVRGRDSAGIQLTFVLKSKKELEDAIRGLRDIGLAEDYQHRTQKGDLVNHSIFISTSPADSQSVNITFTYKTFSIVGELGRNVADLRKSIQNDQILHFFSASAAVCETALTHTRWASVGSITEENCHPVNNYTTVLSAPAYPCYPGVQMQINAVLNGDIDNYPALRQTMEAESALIAQSVTTDTKIIPLQIEKYLKTGRNLSDAFRLAVNDFEGSHAIAMTSDLAPGKMFLALKGSGQSIYIGVNTDQYMFSSELYGLVEVMPRFIKMNGEAGNGAVPGQIFILDQNKGGGLAGISACSYDGTAIELTDNLLQTAEITTRDIDRSNFPHYFLKEISESALSIKRTLRGKYRVTSSNQIPAQVFFNLGTDIVPDAVRSGLVSGMIKNIVVIGHGTAAVAGQAVADALSNYLQSRLNIQARVASELSGFGLNRDLSDTLVIPITQSGTTTDTNRAVAMAAARGARVIAIVNRRQSDITAISHGVFYTSDGRDIEMSVASTKAFYAQIIAGQVLALFFAQLLGVRTDDDIASQLRRLESAPRLMNQLFECRNDIAASVKEAVNKRYWAIVGSGPNKAAADEIRIKLSELCYRTISSDIVENKKHIDLSAEPLILVCAAGNPEAVVEDVVKDVAIFKAHKATVIVFADEGDSRFNQIADAVISVPVAPAPLPVILNTMVGHLWGYYAACAIDEEAQIFREFRGRLAKELAQKTQQDKLTIFDMIADVDFRRIINEFYELFNARRRDGAFGILGGKIIADLPLLLKYSTGKLPLQDMRLEFKNEDDLVSPFVLLDLTLGMAIDELTRPIDAIRHQAKTVTVGTSRKEKKLEGIIFDLLESLDFSLKNLTYRNILTISRIQPAIAAVRGYTVYNLSGLDEQGNPTDNSMIAIQVKGGVAAAMKSRADHSTTLMGTKKMIASSGHTYIGRGKSDGVPLVIIPLLGENNVVGNLLLIHISYNETLSLKEKIKVLGYRYQDIRNLVNEYNLPWHDECLVPISLEKLFSEQIEVIAEQIKSHPA